MAEIWLHSNRRPLLVVLVLHGSIILLAALVAAGLFEFASAPWMRVTAAILLAVESLIVLLFAWMQIRPRLAYRDGHLLINLRSGPPLRVPIEIVEGFLLGRAPGLVPGNEKSTAETTTLVIRLAESATEWAMIEVHPKLGRWCGGYVTVFGTWCEPLSLDLVNRLNRRLAEVQTRTSDHSSP